MKRPKTLSKGVKPQDKVRAGFYSTHYNYCISAFESGTKFRYKFHKCLIFIRLKWVYTEIHCLSSNGQDLILNTLVVNLYTEVLGSYVQRTDIITYVKRILQEINFPIAPHISLVHLEWSQTYSICCDSDAMSKMD